MAQSKPRIVIRDAPHPLIRLEPFAARRPTKYASWAPEGSDAERSAVLLSNDSDQPILAISSHWTIVGPDGSEQRRREQCENVFNEKGPVVESHSTVLLGVNLCVSERGAASRGRLRSAPDPSLALASATLVQVSVDGVLFANGELFGANASEYAQDLNTRAAMATKLAADVRKLLAQGNSRPAAVIAIGQTAHEMPGKAGTLYRAYLGSLERFAPQQPQMFDGYLTFLDRYKLPAPIIVKIAAGMNGKMLKEK